MCSVIHSDTWHKNLTNPCIHVIFSHFFGDISSFSFSNRQVKSMEYSVIIFDTAPTGHTLRFLSFPSVLEKALAKVSQLSGRFGPMMQQMSGMMGMQGNPED